MLWNSEETPRFEQNTCLVEEGVMECAQGQGGLQSKE